MNATAISKDVAAEIRALAGRHGVSYRETETDILAHHITRLAGDDVEFDEIEQLVIALQRAGCLSRRDAVLLQVEYLHQTNS